MSGLISHYKILKEHNLIIEYHSGILDVDSFIAFKKSLTFDSLFVPSLHYFVHLKNVTFLTNMEDIDKYVRFLEANSNFFGNRRVALITNTPNQVVSTTIFKMMQQNKSQSVEIFSTDESALEWLNSSFNKNENLAVLAELMLG
jgi:hypothetical protein